MNELLQQISAWISLPIWVLKAFLIVLAALLLEVVYRAFVGRLGRLAKKSETLWDDAVVYAGRKPISLLIWWQGVLMAALVIAPHTDFVGFSAEFLNAAQQLGLVLAATWLAFRLVTGFEKAFVVERRRQDRSVDITTVSILARVVRIAVIVTGILTILAIFNIPISGFLAAGGVGGIAVGLAARDLLANFFGGLMVFMDRPFSVGDWVRSPDQHIEGVVEKIGWRMTTIRTFDKRPMYVPNATFTSLTVENPSRMTHRRIFEHIGVRYDDFAVVRKVVDGIREMVTNHSDLDDSQTTMVHFNVYGQSSLDIMVYCFTHTTVWTEYHRIREDVLLKIGDIIESHGAQIAFPTRTLKLEQETPFSVAQDQEFAQENET